MVWVRTPLFWLTFLSAFFLAAATTTLIATSISPSVALEIWIRDDGARNAYRGICWILWAISFVGIVSSAIFEFRLARGWEPQWLTKFVPGCVVEGFTSRDHKMLVVLRTPDHQILELELDKDERHLANVGDVVQVWYIGKYLAHMTAIEKGAVAIPTFSIPRFSGYTKQNLTAWTIMLSSPAVAGILCGKGIEHMIFREMTQSDYGEKWSISGMEPAIWGWCLFIVGLMLATWTAWKWIAGWDDSFVDQMMERR